MADANKSKLYFESHITIKPVFDEDLEDAKTIAKWNGFRVANLIMRRGKSDPGTLSKDDTFMSSRSDLLDDITLRTVKCCKDLKEWGFRVLRAKVEDTVWDTKINDEHGCL